MSDAIKRYRRPDQQWKCGLREKGVLCETGPDHRHRCGNENLNQNCHPKRTLIWWRRYLPIALASITAAVLVTASNMPNYPSIIAPGPLTLSHSQLISNPDDPHRCAACHDDDSATSLTGQARREFDSQSVGQLSETVLMKHSQSDRCIACHSRDMPQLAMRSAHDLPIEVITEMTAWVKKSAKRTGLIENIYSTANKSRDLACSVCHREHQGPDHDLQAIASSRCQACHQDSFKSFSSGHPQFEQYPPPKAKRIAFDHRKHHDSHFAKTSTEFDCRGCHFNTSQRSNVGQIFRSLPFEVACAKCHEASIKSSVSEGAIVFQVPSIDVEGLSKRNVDIENWPEEASLMLDGKIPPLMQWLLMGEVEGSLALKGLDSNADLSTLQLDSVANRNSLASLTTASRMIVEKIGSAGQNALSQQFVGNNVDHETSHFDIGVQSILRGAPPDLFRIAFEDWFGSRQQSRKKWKPLKPGTHLKSGGWMIDSNRLSISYVATGHADQWLASILESANDVIQFDSRTEGTDEELDNSRKLNIAKQLLSVQSVGGCTECHSDLSKPMTRFTFSSNSNVDPVALTENSKDRWHAERASIAARALTRFDHGPHLIQPQLYSCVACHSWNEDRQTNLSLHEFASIKIEQCSSCHSPKAAGDQCTQCHNYHVNQR